MRHFSTLFILEFLLRKKYCFNNNYYNVFISHSYSATRLTVDFICICDCNRATKVILANYQEIQSASLLIISVRMQCPTHTVIVANIGIITNNKLYSVKKLHSVNHDV